ncbi:aldo/keto reductase [Polychytrium aggregatum]|uniref:aldo/keto reductase n=1 Tax=Polychytrium aggregatum TaxID=110093 RepID=UPI0022FF2607|nr:aldo/keto reductase [Polychytrium aggregatum]KAI9205405.1 aldo/keto reductase [Polychytrium aggregatum]
MGLRLSAFMSRICSAFVSPALQQVACGLSLPPLIRLYIASSTPSSHRPTHAPSISPPLTRPPTMSPISKIPTRALGRNGPQVSCLGLGCMGMSEFYGASSEEESLQVLNRAIDLGCTFWDTADVYGLGENEKLLAKVLATRRDEVFLCTKFGIVRDPVTKQFTGVRGTPEYVRKSCEDSLERLGVKTIDLYYQHRPDASVPIEDTVRAMAELVAEGKVRYLGLSECNAETLRRAHKVHPIAAIQMEFSPWVLDIEQNDVLKTARELGVAIVPYSPLGRGFLSGQIKSIDDLDENDYRRFNPRFMGDNFAKNLELVRKFESLAKQKNVTSSQYVLAWVLSQGIDFIPIPGTKRIKYLEENLVAATITITPEEDKVVRDLLSQFPVSGARYYVNAAVINSSDSSKK